MQVVFLMLLAMMMDGKAAARTEVAWDATRRSVRFRGLHKLPARAVGGIKKIA